MSGATAPRLLHHAKYAWGISDTLWWAISGLGALWWDLLAVGQDCPSWL